MNQAMPRAQGKNGMNCITAKFSLAVLENKIIAANNIQGAEIARMAMRRGSLLKTVKLAAHRTTKPNIVARHANR
jgi:hypothetical protein